MPDHGATLAALFAAAEAQDWKTFASFFADGATMRQNVSAATPVSDAIEWMPALFADGTTLAYENVQRHVGDDHAVEMHDAVFTKPDGRVIRLDACVVVAFDAHGKVLRSHEYIDSAAAAALVSESAVAE